MKGDLTEAELTDSFKRAMLLPNRLAWRRLNGHTVSYILTEFSARDGRADIVVIPRRISQAAQDWTVRIGKGVSTPGEASVLAALPKASTLSEDEVTHRAGLSRSGVHRILRQLEEVGLAHRTRGGRYRLETLGGENQVELWAYELKLSDWGHALYQASQYRTFAHTVAIVLAEEYAHRVKPQLEIFRRFNVGVVTLNSGSNRIRVLVRPRRASPRSRSHYLYAISVLARRLLEMQNGVSHRRVTGGLVPSPPTETLHNRDGLRKQSVARSSRSGHRPRRSPTKPTQSTAAAPSTRPDDPKHRGKGEYHRERDHPITQRHESSLTHVAFEPLNSTRAEQSGFGFPHFIDGPLANVPRRISLLGTFRTPSGHCLG